MPTKKTSPPRTSKSPTGTKPPVVRRRPGRPARISREAIIQKSLEILATTPIEDFMVKTVAQELGTASMAIYNYFDSREDLLVAVADEVCLLFKAPKRQETWQDTLLAWLWALKKHADRYPVMLSIIGVNGHTSAGWLKITAPITELMHDQLGLSKKSLALASYLFASTAAAMIHVVSASEDYRKPEALPKPDDLNELGLEDSQLTLLKMKTLSSLKQKEIFDTLFAQLIKGIEVFL